MPEAQQVHHYHHSDPEPITYAVEVTRTTRGYTYTVSVKGGSDPALIMREVSNLTAQLETKYPKDAE